MARLLPAGVESEERIGDLTGGWLFPAEEAVVAGAVETRRRQFTAARTCARLCLARLGVSAVPILPGPGGDPTWPLGLAGSITHCGGYAAAAVGSATTIVAVGIDAEPDAPLPPGVLDLVAATAEQDRLVEARRGTGDPCWDRLLFSAKEAVFKAWFPMVGQWLDAREVDVRFGPARGTFTAALARPGLVVDGLPLGTVEGRWERSRGLLLTAVVLTHR